MFGALSLGQSLAIVVDAIDRHQAKMRDHRKKARERLLEEQFGIRACSRNVHSAARRVNDSATKGS